MTGLGWTYQDNIATVDYDNSVMGYVCGFNTNGNITLHLPVTGAPGYHTIDLYPSNYLGPSAPNASSIAIYRYPILTPYDGPSQVPEFHFSFLITGTITTAVSTVTSTSTTTSVSIASTTITATAPAATSTATITSTASGTTSTATVTSTSVSTNVQTTNNVPGMAYAVMAVLLIGGVAVGFVAKRPSAGGK